MLPSGAHPCTAHWFNLGTDQQQQACGRKQRHQTRNHECRPVRKTIDQLANDQRECRAHKARSKTAQARHSGYNILRK
jgi:hypothetical protein